MLIQKDKEVLLADGFQIFDDSSRKYHYKNDHLFWDYRFQKEWLVDIEQACVTIHLTYGEPAQPKETPNINISWRAEVYRQGQESRIDESNEKIITLEDVKNKGISSLVINEFEEGAKKLP